ncbi:hypothetical protein [Paraburkholderia oxyphila]|uniref:hypothetical protein n=1 Tax=Paraburkholderia oxyphila TaxID=614212 RepID=UPI0005BDCCCB|nr:hypothetical protein [Paraburkholderia oxyphila]
MENRNRNPRKAKVDLAFDRAMVLTVSIIRRAQGKTNPDDFAYGSPEFEQAADDYLEDLTRAFDRHSAGVARGEDDLRYSHS